MSPCESWARELHQDQKSCWMALHCTGSLKVWMFTWLSAGLCGTLPTLNLLVLNRALWHSLLRNGDAHRGPDVIIISRCEKRDLFLTTRLPQPSSGSSAYVVASRFSEAQTCKQVVGLGFRTHCHRRASRVSELVFFTGKHPEGPLSKRVLFFFFSPFACRSGKTYVSPQ